MVGHPNVQNEKLFNFKFDFKEMAMINKIGKKTNINSFFTKMMTVNKKKSEVEINKNHLEYVTDFLLNFIEANCKHLNDSYDSKFTFAVK